MASLTVLRGRQAARAPRIIRSALIGDENVSIEVDVSWADTRRTRLRVKAVAHGPSHWKLERLEEAIILDPTESPPRTAANNNPVLPRSLLRQRMPGITASVR